MINTQKLQTIDTITDVTTIAVGVVGLGLMGCSIITCMIMAGPPVVAIAPVSVDLQDASKRIREHLLQSKEQGLIDKETEHYLEQLVITED